MLTYERWAQKEGYEFVIGVDEAGRGPLAGPVVAAAVLLKSCEFRNRVDDSKKLTGRQRREAFFEIMEKSVFGVGLVSAGAIDLINIFQAANRAVEIAVARLTACFKDKKPCPQNVILLLDGRLSPELAYPAREITGGDGLSLSIAAASIVAKFVRDRIMEIYDRVYPQYGFRQHKGYGTKGHFENIARHGLSPIHRRTFCRRVLCH